MIDHLYKENILSLDPYTATRVSETNLLLDWNETFSCNQKLYDYLANELRSRVNLTRYPPINTDKIKEKIIGYLKSRGHLETSNIQLFNGTDSALKCIFDCFCSKGSNVLFPIPNYDQVKTFVATNEGNLIHCNYTIEDIKNKIEDHYIDICYISNPHNPTGTVLNDNRLTELITDNPKTLFIIDEAYIEFTEHIQSSIDFIMDGDYDNVIVARTFSKMFGLAGVRLGYLVAPKKIIDYLNKIRNIKEVNTVALLAAEYLLDNPEFIEEQKELIDTCKMKLYSVFEKYSIPYIKSQTNFIYIELFGDKEIYRFKECLRTKNIVIRDKGEYLRMTVGTNFTTVLIIQAIENEYGK